jgi:hypothetical protein
MGVRLDIDTFLRRHYPEQVQRDSLTRRATTARQDPYVVGGTLPQLTDGFNDAPADVLLTRHFAAA